VETDHARGVSDAVILSLSALIGYLIGSIPVANLVARRTAGIDLRNVGDHNPGFWNALQTLGGRRSAVVFCGDSAKGVTAALTATILLSGDVDLWWIGYLAVGAAMIGHAFPLWAGFRGGRSVLTFAGGMVILAPLSALGAIAVIGVYSAVTRQVPRAIRIGVASFPLIQLLIEGPYRTAATGVLMTFIGLRFVMAARSTRGPSIADED
jgi:glycerol-3-phosphate acyltransferase PlsY